MILIHARIQKEFFNLRRIRIKKSLPILSMPKVTNLSGIQKKNTHSKVKLAETKILYSH